MAFARLLAKLDIDPDYVEPDGEVYMTHAAFEVERPDELAAADTYERHHQAMWLRRHDSLEGYEPHRAFPCPGMLRVEQRHLSDALWPVECDVCGYQTGVPVGRTDPDRLRDVRLAKAGVPEMFAGKKFDSSPEQEPTVAACREWVRGFKREPLPAVTLWGSPGRGKSHLICSMVEALVQMHGAEVVYRSATQLFDEMQAGFDDATYERRWQRALNVPVLALDDIGAGSRSEWRMERLAALVDHRFAKELPILVATNVPPGGWERAFGPRTKSRLGGMNVSLHLEGPDRRAQGVQETLEVATPA